MAKKTEQEKLLADLKRYSNAISEIVDALNGLLFDGESTNAQAGPVGKENKTYTFEDIRELLAEKARGGGREDVRTLLQKFGAARLSDVPPADYGALAAEAEKIGNG